MHVTDYHARLLNLFDPATVFRFLFICTSIVILLGILSQIGRFHFGLDNDLMQVFDLNRELNIPTWYATILLFVSSLLLWLLGWLSTHQRKHWYGLAAVFLYISMDEAAGLHERSDPIIRSYLDVSGVFHFSWILAAVPIMIVLGLVFGKFILGLEKNARILMILAAIIFVGGGLGVEMIGGWYAEQYGQSNPVFSALSIVEESLELFGTVIFITALTRLVQLRLSELST